jgi:hypothetical protein
MLHAPQIMYVCPLESEIKIVSVCVRVCVCVRERERERERGLLGEDDSYLFNGRCVSVCV